MVQLAKSFDCPDRSRAAAAWLERRWGSGAPGTWKTRTPAGNQRDGLAPDWAAEGYLKMPRGGVAPELVISCPGHLQAEEAQLTNGDLLGPVSRRWLRRCCWGAPKQGHLSCRAWA